MLTTVFTPTYNRAHLLSRLYKSLCDQTCRDFEWLIVDDGSTDDTESLIQSYIETDKISIRYYKQANGGKHRAINRGVREARGELFFIVDSDDYLPEDALETVVGTFAKIKNNDKIGGVCGLDQYASGEIVGSGLPLDEIVCNSLDVRLNYHVTGDLKEVYRTDVLREFPFPEIDGERFCPEDLVWNRIAQKYDLLFFNQPIYIAEYQEGGLTDRIVRVRMESPVASVITYQELNSYDIPFGQKVKAAINYWRFRLCIKTKSQIPQLKSIWFLMLPFGCLFHFCDKKTSKR